MAFADPGNAELAITVGATRRDGTRDVWRRHALRRRRRLGVATVPVADVDGI